MAMVSEFVSKVFPKTPSTQRVRLGVPHPELLFPDIEPAELKMLQLFNRWADAIVLQDDRTIIIEGKIRPRLGPTEALEVYSRLLLEDEQFKNRWKLPVEKWFVYVVEDPVLVALAREKGMRAIQFEWSGWQAYRRLLQPRERRGSLG